MWANDSGGGYVTNTQFIDLPDDPNASAHFWAWKQNNLLNNGYPYIDLFDEIPRLEIDAYKQQAYICVFGNRTLKEEFLSNGLAILTPTSCTVTQEYNGMWSVSLIHPYDAESRWKLLQISNILKVMGQLFTIKKVDEQWSGKTGSISVYAEHIFYQMQDGWIYPHKKLEATSGTAALTAIYQNVTYEQREGAYIFGFDAASDMQYDEKWVKYIDDGCTPIECILGDGSIIEANGGELYRNNFYFSVDKRMENAKDDAFDIRIGKNLSGIKRTVDTSTMVNYFRAFDEWGGWFAYAWDFGAFFGDIFPHYVVRSQNFQFPDEAYDEESDWSYDEWFSTVLAAEADAFLKKNGKPVIGYEISIEDVRQNPDFSIIADEEIRVGDKGRVYDERLGGYLTIEVSGTVYDAITGKCAQITVGDRQSFVQTSMPNLMFDITPIPQHVEPVPYEGKVPVLDSGFNFCYDKNGEQIFEEVDE